MVGILLKLVQNPVHTAKNAYKKLIFNLVGFFMSKKNAPKMHLKLFLLTPYGCFFISFIPQEFNELFFVVFLLAVYLRVAVVLGCEKCVLFAVI